MCSTALNCDTCTGGVSVCTTCDVSASPPRFLREDDSYCVLEAECDQTADYYWDTTGEACAGKCGRLLIVHHSKRQHMFWYFRNTHTYHIKTMITIFLRSILLRGGGD